MSIPRALAWVATLTALAHGASVVDATTTPNVMIALQQDPSLCLTLGNDGFSASMAMCASTHGQAFGFQPAQGHLRHATSGACLDGMTAPLRVTPCGSSSHQAWNFGADGRIVSRSMPAYCVGTGNPNQKLPQFGSPLFLEPCASSTSLWGTLPIQGFAAGSSNNGQPPLLQQPGYPTTPQQGPFNPATPFGGQPPQPPPKDPFAVSGFDVVNEDASSKPSIPSLDGNELNLCACIADKESATCIKAVRDACTRGHLPQQACHDSFLRGKHERVSDDVLRLIDKGAKCSRFDVVQLRAQAQRPDVTSRDAQSLGRPVATDHFLCICLEEGQSNSQKCTAAVRAACMMGRIPAGDCQASISRNSFHGVTSHVLRLIDNGAQCPNRLARLSPATGGVPKPHVRNEPGVGDRDLCSCLDDHKSAQCGDAMKRACAAGSLPADDCLLASRAKYLGGVTRHVLRLIDHGADCPAHRAMTFTNRGCHCLQTWSEGGKTYSFPNNCNDPGGKRGYAWCKTYSVEGCAGIEGSTEWDRCDNPRVPVHRDDDDDDDDGEDEHYLCICLDDDAADQVCGAAVQAACQVGHLPSEACRASFQDGNHAIVTDSILAAVKKGAKCGSQGVYGDGDGTRSPTSTRAIPVKGLKEATQPPVKPLAKFCGHGLASRSTGKCECSPGYTGATCQECVETHFGFPNCQPKVPCANACGRGTCDWATGTCACPPNFVGPTCARCAPGTRGSKCTPENQLGWSFTQTILYFILLSGIGFAAYLLYQRVRAARLDALARAGASDGEGGIHATRAGYTRAGTVAPHYDGEDPEEQGGKSVDIKERSVELGDDEVEGIEFVNGAPIVASAPSAASPAPPSNAPARNGLAV